MFMKKMIRLLQLKSCLICGADDLESLCQSCQQFLPILTQTCQQCAQILPASLVSEINQPEILICHDCLHQPPPFTASYALFPYEFPIVEFIRRLKFQGQLVYAATFGAMLIKAIRERWYIKSELPDCLIPVPLHSKRLRERGFNQALEISRPIGRHFHLPILSRQILRTRATDPQTLLSAQERGDNVEDAFRSKIDLTGRYVAVLDDVVTTGHTIRAFCRELKRAGARRIDVWCCARAISMHTEVAQSVKTR